MKRLFAMEAGNVENVSFLQPIQGNFKGVVDPEVHTDADTSPNPAAAAPDDGSTTPTPDSPPAAAPASGRSSGAASKVRR